MLNKKPLQSFKFKHNIEEQIEYTHSILDKLFVTSMWNNGKMNSILTINGIVGAGIFAFLRLPSEAPHYVGFLVFVSLFFFIISILICLAHSIPLYDAKIGNTSNLRTIICITQLDKYQYHEKCRLLTKRDMLQYNCHQISGMARNNATARKKMATAATVTFAGFLILSFSLLLHIGHIIGLSEFIRSIIELVSQRLK